MESLDLLQAERDGRRVRYSSRRYSMLAEVLGSNAAGKVAADPAAASPLITEAQEHVENLSTSVPDR